MKEKFLVLSVVYIEARQRVEGEDALLWLELRANSLTMLPDGDKAQGGSVSGRTAVCGFFPTWCRKDFTIRVQVTLEDVY